MSHATYRCPCGALLEFRQDIESDRGTTSRTWKCKDCATPVPGMIGEKLSHQHPP